jgi:hypothetical protein
MREDPDLGRYLNEALEIATFAPGVYEVVATFAPP